MTLEQAIATLREHAPDPRSGLPGDVFYLVSSLTPLINVDLLVQDDEGRTLLTWREDQFYKGWHVPGGIIRFKERAAARINAVAQAELGTTVMHDADPLATHELFAEHRDVRGHFISLAYRCKLTGEPDPARRAADPAAARHGEWAWHAAFPEAMIPQHGIYRRFFP